MTTETTQTPQPTQRPWFIVVVSSLSMLIGLGSLAFALIDLPRRTADVNKPLEATEASEEEVHRMCAACHATPTVDSFPKAAWRKEVKQGFDFFHADPSLRFPYPSLESVVKYFERRAPEKLDALPNPSSTISATFERHELPFPDAAGPPGVAHVSSVRLFHKDQVDLLVCDALNQQVLVYQPLANPPKWTVIADGLCCAHAEVVDLDGDGRNDVVLACLGSFYATDDRVGSVVWLRNSGDGEFHPITLLDGVGRVADVRAADFRGAGRLDLVVAEFGWHRAGGIQLLENQTTDWTMPKFVSTQLDQRHGTTHVPVTDLNGDGKPDFVALISQGHETIVAFINDGQGGFKKEPIFTAPHPAFGCHGLQLADLDGDGKLDVILTNGDSLDAPYILKPYHGVTWLRNTGGFPFESHRLADCYGAGSPVVADFTGDGKLDVAFVSFLPAEFFPQRGPLASVTLLEQFDGQKFTAHTLELGTCDHLSCAAFDPSGMGRPDLIVGSFVRAGGTASILKHFRNRYTGK